MGSPYIGEIRMFAGNFAPVDWAFCDGSLQQSADNDTLFNLIGTTYGGDGQTTFALPNFMGRVPLHQGNGYVIGQKGGAETAVLVPNQLPVHTHPLAAYDGPTNTDVLAGNALAQGRDGNLNAAVAAYHVGGNGTLTALANNSIKSVTTAASFPLMQPCLGINYIISLYGIYPSQ